MRNAFAETMTELASKNKIYAYYQVILETECLKTLRK